MRGTERHNDEHGERRQHHKYGRHPEDKAVGLSRHDVFFKQQLDSVSYGLQQSVWTNAHGAKPDLHVSKNLALQPVHRDHCNGKAEEDNNDINEGPKHVSGGAGREIAG